MLRTSRFLAVASSCFCLVVLGLAACGSATTPSSATPASPASAGFTGYHWRVVDIALDGKVTSIPGRFNVDLRFSRAGRFLADDPVNSHSGRFRLTPGGFTTSAVVSTAVGYAGHDPVILLSQRAMMTLTNGARAAARVTGNRLVVSAGSYTLTCQRHGPAGNDL